MQSVASQSSVVSCDQLCGGRVIPAGFSETVRSSMAETNCKEVKEGDENVGTAGSNGPTGVVTRKKKKRSRRRKNVSYDPLTR